jgi:hypothetical protein
MRSVIHPGFCHSGTTSLQKNFFSRRPDLCYGGIPYSEMGGLFSAIKYHDNQTFDADRVRREAEKYLGVAGSERKRIVLSDETFTEQPEIYYTPAMMPVEIIAERLQQLLGEALIIFTIRNQFQYVLSCYLNLKRNYALISGRPIEGFDDWFAGQFTQERNLFLRNLDYAKVIKVYASKFSMSSVRILPLEIMVRSGACTYLQMLGEQIDLPIDEFDVTRFSVVRNRRANRLEEELLTLWPDQRFRRFWRNLESLVGRDALQGIGSAPPTDLQLSNQQRQRIVDASADGNRWIERQFGYPLKELGYP